MQSLLRVVAAWCCCVLLPPQVPGLFASSFTKFQAMAPPEGHSQLYWMDWWLRCVPLPEHMHVSYVPATVLPRLASCTDGTRLHGMSHDRPHAEFPAMTGF